MTCWLFIIVWSHLCFPGNKSLFPSILGLWPCTRITHLYYFFPHLSQTILRVAAGHAIYIWFPPLLLVLSQFSRITTLSTSPSPVSGCSGREMVPVWQCTACLYRGKAYWVHYLLHLISRYCSQVVKFQRLVLLERLAKHSYTVSEFLMCVNKAAQDVSSSWLYTQVLLLMTTLSAWESKQTPTWWDPICAIYFITY